MARCARNIPDAQGARISIRIPPIDLPLGVCADIALTSSLLVVMGSLQRPFTSGKGFQALMLSRSEIGILTSDHMGLGYLKLRARIAELLQLEALVPNRD